jgi:WD40 repeat protein
MSQTAPFVFLSHSGADTDAARKLKDKLLASSDARAAGVKVWFDKDNLRPGAQWQPQIEQAIAIDATAFVVYVGSRGVMNWVDVEVRTALSRAATDKDFLFIPALAAESAGPSALPPFAELHQGVRDPLGEGEELAKLLKAVLRQSDWDRAPKIIDEPFVGLRSMREEEADRFFGRETEVKELVEKFCRRRIVAIVADSGTGKSSLAQAGFIPAFRGGALIEPIREDAREKIWQVVTIRPGADPVAGLRQGVTEAAERLGLSLDERASLRRQVSVDDVGETAFALQCGLPSAKPSTLLIVDQFEELFTATPNAFQAPFVNLLLALADGPSDVRVLINVRADYFNLASGIKDASGKPALFERLTGASNAAILRLKAMSAEGIKEAVCKPLRLAGEGDEAANAALLEAVQSDISHQASDLPLLQVALRAASQERRATGRPMLECYQSVGRISGALAREADKARDRLPQEDQARLESIFVRLVRLGDTGGATRRPASLDEFDARRGALLQKLGSGEFGALVVVGETRAELSHEALITQWPWLQDMLKANAADVRRLERLMDRSRDWRDAPEEDKRNHFAFGADRELFSELAYQRPDWVSQDDRVFIEKSMDWKAIEQRKEARRNLLLRVAAAALAFALISVGWFYLREREARVEADSAKTQVEKEFQVARRNESVALTALADIEAAKHPVNAAKLAVAAWPREGGDTATPRLNETLDVLGKIVPNLRERWLIKGPHLAAFSPDGSRIVTASADKTARVWDVATGKVIAVLSGHQDSVISAVFSRDGARIATASYDRTARVWDTATGKAIATLSGHEGGVLTAAFSPDGSRIVTASQDNTARVWHSATGTAIAVLSGHKDRISSAAFSPDETRVVTASHDGTARVWDAATGKAIATLSLDEGPIWSAAFSSDGSRIVTASYGKTARVWDAATGTAILVLSGHDDGVLSAAFSPDGSRIVTASNDETARVWDAATGKVIVVLSGHQGPVWSAAFSPDGSHILTVSWDGTARVWDVATPIAVLSGHEDELSSAAFSPDGSRIVTASRDNTARVWDAATGTAIVTLHGHDDGVLSATFSPDGSRIVTASFDKSARVWDAATGTAIAVLRGHGAQVDSAAFSPDGSRIVTASSDKTARVWDAATGKAVLTLSGHGDEVLSAAFSPDGSRIVTASIDGTARVWDAATGKAIATFSGHKDRLNSASFSSDGSRIVTASEDKTARVWNAATGKAIAVLGGHEDLFGSASFSPDETRIVTASRDGTARVWDAATGKAIAVLSGHQGPVWSAAFSPDGTRVVTASEDKTARVWAVGAIPKGNILQVACALLRMREDPVSLEGVTEYPLTFDRPICATDPPPPDLTREPAAR